MKKMQDCNLEEEKKDTCEDSCGCEENCKCDENCKKDETCKCGDKCDCECEENKECHCEEECKCKRKDEPDYLALAQRIQAEFENYRRRMADQLVIERQEGIVSVINVFLPCLDTFKEAKKSITDEKVLEGVNMIENKIMDALDRLEVERIESVGQKFDPNFHDVIAVMHNENYDDDIILEEYQAGYKYKGKVIRYSKVIVNKKEGN